MNVSDRRILPRGGVSVSLLGLGCAQMGGLYREVPLSDCEDLFSTAWNAGVRYFDTAPYYGYTRSERRLGVLAEGRDGDGFVLSTKVGRLMLPDASVGEIEGEWVRPLPFRPTYDYTHDGILRSFEASQQRLGMLRADIVYVHDIGRLTHGERHDHYWEQLTNGGGFAALDRLRSEGQIGAIGLGVNEADVVADTLARFDLDATMLAGRYTLLEQNSLDLLDLCARRGVAIVAAGVFNSGILAGNAKFDYGDAPDAIVQRTRQLRQLCDAFDVPLSAAAIQFPLHHPAVASCVVGARSAQQFSKSIDWMNVAIPDAFWQELKRSALLHEAAPVPGAVR